MFKSEIIFELNWSGDVITAYCVRTCIKYKARKPPVGIGRYALGQKRCQACEIFMHWDSHKCPCCKGPLRQLPRSRKGKEKYLIQKLESTANTNYGLDSLF